MVLLPPLDHHWVGSLLGKVHIGKLLCFLRRGDLYVIWAPPVAPLCLVGEGELNQRLRLVILLLAEAAAQ